MSDDTKQQLDLIINMLKEQSAAINETRALLAASQAKVDVLETKVAILESTVSSMEVDILSLKEQLNARNQEGKLLSVRFFGVPVTDEETKSTDGGDSFRKQIYDRYLKPCLSAARANGDIPTVPQAHNVIAKCFRLGKPTPSGTRPPPLLVTFTSYELRSAIFRYKRDSFPIPSEAEKINGTKRYVMVEDLTSPTYSLLKAMKDHPDVSKAYTIEGRIRYSKVDKPDFILKVKSVFEPIEKILS